VEKPASAAASWKEMEAPKLNGAVPMPMFPGLPMSWPSDGKEPPKTRAAYDVDAAGHPSLRPKVGETWLLPAAGVMVIGKSPAAALAEGPSSRAHEPTARSAAAPAASTPLLSFKA
jgi:hypothetical protein